MGDRYGPTNEKLGVYLKELMEYHEPGVPPPLSRAPAPTTT